MLETPKEVQVIVDVVMESFSTTQDKLSTSSREDKYVLPRQITWFVLLDIFDTKYSARQLGCLFVNDEGDPFNHSTISHAKKIMPDRLKTEPWLKRKYLEILSKSYKAINQHYREDLNFSSDIKLLEDEVKKNKDIFKQMK